MKARRPRPASRSAASNQSRNHNVRHWLTTILSHARSRVTLGENP